MSKVGGGKSRRGWIGRSTKAYTVGQGRAVIVCDAWLIIVVWREAAITPVMFEDMVATGICVKMRGCHEELDSEKC